jgi:thiol:disulfide interchange protein DsbD
MLERFVRLSLLLVGVGAILPVFVSAQGSADEHVKVQLIAEQDAIVPGKEIRMGIRFDLQEGWHTYWLNPGDSGEPPRIEWQLPAGFQTNAVQWPYPERMSTPPFADYGYEHQVLLAASIRPPADLKQGANETVGAHVHYLVCRDVCIPGQKKLELTLPVRSHAVASADGPLFVDTQQRLPQPAPPNWRISAISVGDEFVLSLRGGKLMAAPQFFPLEPEQIENAAAQNATTIPGGWRLHLKKSKHLLKLISRLKGVIIVGSGKAYVIDALVSQASGKVSESTNMNGGTS